jgi:hypothetical protein
MFDAMLLIVWGIVTWCVASEGAHGAAINAVVVVLSGLLAMNLFEPFASFGQGIFASIVWSYRMDIIALVGLFIAFVLGLRMLFEKLSPVYVATEGLAYELGRWGFGLLTGYVTMAFLLTALHTAPLPREFMDFKPERANLFNALAPDRQWLGFTQWVSEHTFVRGGIPRVFDGPYADFIDDPNNSDGRNKVWPSFPIRYAHRREQYASGRAIAGPAAQPQRVAPVRNAPSGTGAAGF